jgi:hypothetical protein
MWPAFTSPRRAHRRGYVGENITERSAVCRRALDGNSAERLRKGISAQIIAEEIGY